MTCVLWQCGSATDKCWQLRWHARGTFNRSILDNRSSLKTIFKSFGIRRVAEVAHFAKSAPLPPSSEQHNTWHQTSATACCTLASQKPHMHMHMKQVQHAVAVTISYTQRLYMYIHAAIALQHLLHMQHWIP